MRRTFSLSCPPSSYPTYPGGDPIILDTLCFSIYSDISTRIRAFSVPNMASDNALDSSVFPTPVGPRNRKEPMGRLGSLRPTLPLRMALEMAVTASSWPTTLWCRMPSRFLRRSDSSSASFLTGILVQPDTTSAISLSLTISFLLSLSFCHFSMVWAIFSRSFSCFFFISPAFS